MSRLIWQHSLIAVMLLFACSPTIIKKVETRTEVKTKEVLSDTGEGAAARDTTSLKDWGYTIDYDKLIEWIGPVDTTIAIGPERQPVRREVEISPGVKAEVTIETKIDTAGQIITEVKIPKIVYPESTKIIHEVEDRTETYAKYFIWFAILAIGAMVVFAVKGIF